MKTQNDKVVKQVEGRLVTEQMKLVCPKIKEVLRFESNLSLYQNPFEMQLLLQRYWEVVRTYSY